MKINFKILKEIKKGNIKIASFDKNNILLIGWIIDIENKNKTKPEKMNSYFIYHEKPKV